MLHPDWSWPGLKEAVMNIKPICAYLIVGSLLVVMQSPHALAQQNSDASKTNVQQAPPERDGQHDFDFEIGRWKTHLSRLQHPLTNSRAWVQYDGTTVVHKLWNGRANLVELEVTGPAGHIEGLSLRLYNPTARQWSLNFASSRGGVLTQPTLGEFKHGRGEFYDQEKFNDRTILVRFVISDITANSCHFEQAFSDDGGKTWEVNWIATDTRVTDTHVNEDSAQSTSGSAQASLAAAASAPDGQHDFDFEIGHWDIPLQRLVDRLAGSHTWVKFDGTSVTRKVWNGRSQIEEFEADSPSGHIEGLTLRLYEPETHQWRLYWANSKTGVLEPPQIGQFKNGVGEFYAQDTWKGKMVIVRFLWTNTTTNKPHFEQSFSDDGGKTWEVNWITDQTRVPDEADKPH
jgi:hypothetical protein